MGRQFHSAALLCLLTLFTLSAQPACGQAVVCDSRELLISASYEDVLARMDGEEASRKMFASQKLNMISYKPKPKDKTEKIEEGVSKGKIDIVGVSCEFGTMYYLMSVRASEKETVIDVCLTQPVGMLRRQSYRYVVTPRGKDQTAISISHELDVVLMKRRLNLVNKIIKKVTYEKACEEVHELTEKMSRCVTSLASQPQSKSDSNSKAGDNSNDDDDAEEPADDTEADNDSDMAENDDSSAPQNKTEDTTTGDAKADAAKSDAEQAATKSTASEPSPSDTNSISNQAAQNSLAPLAPTDPVNDVKIDPVTNPSTKPANEPAPSSSTTAPAPVPTPLPNSAPTAAMIPAESPTAEPTIEPSPEPPATPPATSATQSSAEKPATPKSLEPSVTATVPATKKVDSEKADDAENQKPKAPVLRVTIEGVTAASGSMRIALFDKNDQYKNFDARNNEAQQGEAFRKVAVKVKKTGKLVYEFKDVPPGSYAIAAFHDKDGNQQLNASVIGLPSEPYGFSRDARGTFGAPKFEDAVIKFDESRSSFSFKIK